MSLTLSNRRARGRRIASGLPFSVFSKGRNRMIVVDVASGNTLNDVSMEKAEQFSNLSWSPNGKDIVFQAFIRRPGRSVLITSIQKKSPSLPTINTPITSQAIPGDGKKIIFSSDRSTYDQSLEQDIPFNLAELDLATGKVTDIKIFNGANNLNPQYSADGTQVYFLIQPRWLPQYVPLHPQQR
jgi:Tol biopolymer transport system component